MLKLIILNKETDKIYLGNNEKILTSKQIFSYIKLIFSTK